MTAISGRRCAELLKAHDPAGCLLKMLLGTSRWASTLCFLNWSPSATPAGRPLFRLVPSVPCTDEIEFGLWATPTVQDAAKATRRWREGRQNNLTAMASLIPTPSASNAKGAVKARIPGTPQYKGNLDEWAENAPGASGRLNPEWIEWLMGYPVGWTDCTGLETPSSRKSRSKSCEASPQSNSEAR